MTGMGRRRWIYPLAAALAGVVMMLRAGSTIWLFNDTSDESFHIAAAVSLIEKGRLVHGIETPPVSRIVQGIALYAAGVRLPLSATAGDRTIYDVMKSFALGDKILTESAVPYWRVLAVARIATLLFAAISLLYVYLLGRWCGGPVVGALATIFFSTDPTLLAHAPLATSDAAACAGFLAATYHALRWIFLRPDSMRAAVAGVAVGVAIGAKFSCLILLPIVSLLLVWRHFRFGAKRLLTGSLAAAITAFLTLWGCYLFDVGRLNESEVIAEGRWGHWIPQSIRQMPLPMPSFPLGVMTIMSHNKREHGVYLNGEVKAPGEGAWWYYFPEALVVKSPIVLTVGMIVAGILALRRARRPRLSIAIASVAIIFMAFAMTSKIQIGVRYLLPLIPLLYLLVALQLARRRWVVLLVILIVASFVETTPKHPDYLSFFNLPASRGCKGKPLLLDSNLDWAQDIARLARWLHAEPPNVPYETRIFGRPNVTRLPDYRMQFNQIRNLSSGLFIVSLNIKYGLYPVKDPADPKDERVLPLPDVIFKSAPIKRIGDSIEVYQLPNSTGQP